MKTVLALTLGTLVAILVSGWSLMLTVGVAHDAWWHFIPVLGYGTACAITFWPVVITLVTGTVLSVVRELGR